MAQTSLDAEVESVLQEIRGNVNAEISLRATPNAELIRRTLLQLEGELVVTTRAWHRLPPVFSNRQGWKAQAELWLKRNLQRATNWYLWEQINFNSATNNALHDLQRLLTIYEREQAILRLQVKALNATIEELKTHRD